jgi:ribokinase
VPPDLAAALAMRADIVVSSRREVGFVRDAFERAGARRSPPVRIETRGGEGVAILGESSETLFSVETFKADDTAGAGDTFLGGFLAAWRAGEVERAVESGVAAAGALLLRRTKKNMGETGVR